MSCSWFVNLEMCVGVSEEYCGVNEFRVSE